MLYCYNSLTQDLLGKSLKKIFSETAKLIDIELHMNNHFMILYEIYVISVQWSGCHHMYNASFK